VNGGRTLILGLTFKENCPDLRNTRVTDIVGELESYGIQVDVWDPWVNAAEAEHEYGIRPIPQPESGVYDSMILAVAHREFAELGAEQIREFGVPGAVLFDVKYLFPGSATDGRL
jgi:UDP-N-acetyl-D-galactosamine dehydrogenase